MTLIVYHLKKKKERNPKSRIELLRASCFPITYLMLFLNQFTHSKSEKWLLSWILVYSVRTREYWMHITNFIVCGCHLNEISYFLMAAEPSAIADYHQMFQCVAGRGEGKERERDPQSISNKIHPTQHQECVANTPSRANIIKPHQKYILWIICHILWWGHVGIFLTFPTVFRPSAPLALLMKSLNIGEISQRHRQWATMNKVTYGNIILWESMNEFYIKYIHICTCGWMGEIFLFPFLFKIFNIRLNIRFIDQIVILWYKYM